MPATKATKGNAREIARALTPAVNAVLLARAHAQLTRERVAPAQKEALQGFDFYADLDRRPGRAAERITDPRDLYLTESDCAPYYAALDELHRAMGYDLAPGYCPILVAEQREREATWTLIDRAEDFFPGCTRDKLLCAGLDKYRQFVDLLVKLVVNAPGYRKPELPR